MRQDIISIEAIEPIPIVGATYLCPGSRFNVKGYVAHCNVLGHQAATFALDVSIEDSLDGTVWTQRKAFTTFTGDTIERVNLGTWEATPKYLASQVRIKYDLAATPVVEEEIPLPMWVLFQVRLEGIF